MSAAETIVRISGNVKWLVVRVYVQQVLHCKVFVHSLSPLQDLLNPHGDTQGQEMAQQTVACCLDKENIERQHRVEGSDPPGEERVRGGIGQGFGHEKSYDRLQAHQSGGEAHHVSHQTDG